MVELLPAQQWNPKISFAPSSRSDEFVTLKVPEKARAYVEELRLTTQDSSCPKKLAVVKVFPR